MTTTALERVGFITATITAKLVANAKSVAKAKSGRIDWRWTKQGVLEIKVHPEL